MTTKTISVLLVDDHPIVRDGFRHILDSTSDIQVVAEAGCGEDAYNLYRQLTPHVVVLDLNIPGMGGLETLNRIRAKDPKARVLIFSMHDSKVMISRAFKAGALGYLTKASAATMIVDAVRQVFRGEIFLDQKTNPFVGDENAEKNGPLAVLTKREFQIFCALAEGLTVKDIGDKFAISQKTAGVHKTNIMKKLNLRNSSELTHLAIRAGVVYPL